MSGGYIKSSPEYKLRMMQVCVRLKREDAAKFKILAERAGTTMGAEIRKMIYERLDESK